MGQHGPLREGQSKFLAICRVAGRGRQQPYILHTGKLLVIYKQFYNFIIGRRTMSRWQPLWAIRVKILGLGKVYKYIKVKSEGLMISRDSR